MPSVGRAVTRKEGFAKATGQAKYIDDLSFEDCLIGTTVRSTIPRGIIKEIRFSKQIPWDEFTIVRASDIPGENSVRTILDDQPFLADPKINHCEEPILLLAHPDKYFLEEARRQIEIIYEPLPALLSLHESLSKSQIIWGKDNLFKSYLVSKGDVASVWQNADLIVEGEYSTGAQEHIYIENNGIVAKANPDDGVTIWGSMQCPYYIQKGLISLFNLPPHKIRVIQTETGGGFGGKEEYPTVIAGHAALLAWKSGRSVKMIYDRSEDMVATTKRHPSLTRHKTAVSKDGRLLAMEIEFMLDGGAYCTLSPVVLSRGTIHSAGPYFCPNIRIESKAVATNTPPHGAFRGFGAPQSIFALERHLNVVAQRLGLSPEEFRRRNFLRPGQKTATGQEIRDQIDLSKMLDRALQLADYSKKKEEYAVSNKQKSHVKRGIGFAAFKHGSGFTGSGEKHLASVVGVEATVEGKVRVLVASTEIGQGTNTMLSQIVADTLGIDYGLVEVAQPDTAFVPNSGPTVASRTCMVVGKLVESAALGLKQTLVHHGFLNSSGYSSSDFSVACRNYIQSVSPLKVISEYQQPKEINWDDTNYRGDAYAAYAWAIYVVDLSIDTLTYEVTVQDVVALQEVGKVIHPVLAAGQIQGGVAQGLGLALYEKVVWKNGRMANNKLTNYIIPTTMDLPPIRVFFEEKGGAYGPSGAKGIGELPMDGPAPAVVNAIENALEDLTGEFNQVPLLPEDIFRVMSQRQKQKDERTLQT